MVDQMRSVLVVDTANVVGSTPDGWWADRPGATRRLHEALLQADTDHDLVVMVLEGGARGAARVGRDGHVKVVHAPKDGDAMVVSEAAAAIKSGGRVTVVTADQMLQARVGGVGATTVGPSWLLDKL